MRHDYDDGPDHRGDDLCRFSWNEQLQEEPMTLDLSKWGGSKVRKRLELLDPDPHADPKLVGAYGQWFPFLADMARAVNDIEGRVAAVEARPATRFP